MIPKARAFGVAGVALSVLCWINAFSRWSIFDLVPTVTGWRHLVLVVAIVSALSVLVAGTRGSRWWLLALFLSVLLFGVLRLH